MEVTNTQSAHNNNMHTASIDQARELLYLLEAGRVEEANLKLNELCRLRETDLYQDIGKLTRELHEAFQAINKDARLHVLVKEDVSDARDKLHYVIQTAETSAHRTLGAIENCAPVIDALEADASALHQQLTALMSDTVLDESAYSMASATDVFLRRIETDIRLIHYSIKDVLMAQEYQDITGQIIQRVIRVVQQLEKHLVDILRVSASYVETESAASGVNRDREIGAATADANNSDKSLGQDDVDGLLDSLGF